MRELGGGRPRPWMWMALAAALVVPAGAVAQVDSGDLTVWGPVSVEGPVAVEANGAQLLLRQPGNSAFQGLGLEFRASAAQLDIVQVQENCVGDAPTPGGLPRVANFALGKVRDRLSPLEPVRYAASALPVDLSPVWNTPGQRLPSQPIADDPVGTAQGAMRDARPSGGPSSQNPPPPPGATPCFGSPVGGPATHPETYQLTDLTVRIRALDPDYTVFWDATPRDDGDNAGLGTASLRADDLTTRLLTRDEDIPMVAQNDALGGSVPASHLAQGLVGNTARGGAGDLAGDGRMTMYRVEVAVHGMLENGDVLDEEFMATEERQEDDLGRDVRSLKFIQFALEGAAGSFESPGAVRLLGGEVSGVAQGAIDLRHASGMLREGDQTTTYDNGVVRLAGAVAYDLRKAEDPAEGSHHPRDAMTMHVQGDTHAAKAAAPPGPLPPMVQAAAAVSLFAVVSGLLAYFWPALKFLVAPLYTRIPKDAVLMHGARENIYRLIREEPGIHAHEIASRLGLGWGTSVYHLNLLEKNSLVVSKHEGRYKRFFATGDHRIQMREAVALLRNPNSRRIAALIAGQPGVIQKDVCTALGVSPSLASWHLQRLADAGLVNAQRIGRVVRYDPGPAWGALNGPPQAAAPAA